MGVGLKQGSLNNLCRYWVKQDCMIQEAANVATVGGFIAIAVGSVMAWLHKRISCQVATKVTDQDIKFTKELNECVTRIERENTESLKAAKVVLREKIQIDLLALKAEVAKDLGYQIAISDKTVAVLAEKYEEIKREILSLP